MSNLSILIISICLGVLCVAGIKSIIMEIGEAIKNRKIKKLLDNDFELYMELYNINEKINERIAK